MPSIVPYAVLLRGVLKITFYQHLRSREFCCLLWLILECFTLKLFVVMQNNMDNRFHAENPQNINL